MCQWGRVRRVSCRRRSANPWRSDPACGSSTGSLGRSPPPSRSGGTPRSTRGIANRCGGGHGGIKRGRWFVYGSEPTCVRSDPSAFSAFLRVCWLPAWRLLGRACRRRHPPRNGLNPRQVSAGKLTEHLNPVELRFYLFFTRQNIISQNHRRFGREGLYSYVRRRGL